MRRALGLVVVLLLSGCAAKAVEEMPEPTESGLGTDAAAPLYDFDAGVRVPEWSVGDWWQYRVEYSSGEKFDAKLVVYGVQGSNYLITSDSRDLALRAAFNHYPNIGPVARSSLDQFIHGAQVSFLKFPMKNQSWQAPYRDFQMEYRSTFATLEVGVDKVPGFVTTMRNAADGRIRMAHGWSPVTKWFTNFTWDFDGTGPTDVTATLQSYGTNHTGTLPLVELIELTHRPFPTTSAPPNAQAPPPNPTQSNAPFKIGAAGSTLIVGYFAGAGGAGAFDIVIEQPGGTTAPLRYEWRPSGAASVFQWHKVASPATGDYQLVASGTAQNSAFLFVEAYEARTTEVQLEGPASLVAA